MFNGKFIVNGKAWLFLDTPAGAHASAVHYSLIETAKANGLEPYDYLKQVLTALPYAETVEGLEVFGDYGLRRNSGRSAFFWKTCTRNS